MGRWSHLIGPKNRPINIKAMFVWFIPFAERTVRRRRRRTSSSTAAMAALNSKSYLSLFLLLPILLPLALAYRPGDIVPMSRMGQYHSVCAPKSQNFFQFSFFFCLVFLWYGLYDLWIACVSQELCGTIWLDGIAQSLE